MPGLYGKKALQGSLHLNGLIKKGVKEMGTVLVYLIAFIIGWTIGWIYERINKNPKKIR